jgi:DNA-binding transcriptional MerR regulator
MSKAAEAFRTISEVASELDVQKHVLRFWEARFPQVRPMKRGGGRRYYRPEDMELLRGIRHLLHAEGYTIKGVQKILREHGVDHVKQYGRVESAAAASQAHGKRARADQSGAERAQASAIELVRARLPSRGPSGRRAGAPSAAQIEAAIKELELCRRIMTETLGPQEPAVRPQKRARAVSA